MERDEAERERKANRRSDSLLIKKYFPGEDQPLNQKIKFDAEFFPM